MKEYDKVFEQMDSVFKEMDKVYKQIEDIQTKVAAGVARKIELGPWKPWFAWRPVTTVSGKRVWWTTIYRRTINTYVDQEDWTRYQYGNLFDVIMDAR